MEARFWTETQQLQKSHTDDRLKDWLVKLLVHLQKKIKKMTETKQNRLKS